MKFPTNVSILILLLLFLSCSIESHEESGISSQVTADQLQLNTITPAEDPAPVPIPDIDAMLQCFAGKSDVKIAFHTTYTRRDIPEEIPHSFLTIEHPDCGREAIGYGPLAIGIRKPNVGAITSSPICEETYPGALFNDRDYLQLPILSSPLFSADNINEVLTLISEFQNRAYELCCHNCTALVTEVYNLVRGRNEQLNPDDIKNTLIISDEFLINPTSSLTIIKYHDPRKFQSFFDNTLNNLE